MEKNKDKSLSNDISKSCELKNLQLNMKAGMEGLDTDKINSIIRESSLGSNYYLHQQKKQNQINDKIVAMNKLAAKLSIEEINVATVKMDKLAEEMEAKRDLSRTIVHLDMDAFFAAVEMRNDPSLKDKPMAVGGQSMLSTSNYIARRYGVRAAMPGFIALKLCPELIIVPPNFDEYQKVSNEVQEVLSEYDRDFSAASLDEAYLDITDYLIHHSKDDVEAVITEIRQKIFEKTQLTASAGIAPNMMLAKICSDQNKPNGQFYIPPIKKAVMDFVRNLSVRKVCGVGGVTEQLLNSQGIVTCNDLWNKRGCISLLFSPSSAHRFLALSLGIGSTRVKSNEDSKRKSMSIERTFNGTNDVAVLKQLCEELSYELAEDLRSHKLMGKTVSIKLKTTDFAVKTRALTLNDPTSNPKRIAITTQNLLSNEMKAVSPGELKLRLMGVRMSSLVSHAELRSKRQCTLDVIFQKKQPVKKQNEVPKESEAECQMQSSRNLTTSLSDLDQTTEGHKNDEKMSSAAECKAEDKYRIKASGTEGDEVVSIGTITIPDSMSTSVLEQQDNILGKTLAFCPVCQHAQNYNSLDELNNHVDLCLNRNAIRDMLRVDRTESKDKSKKTKRKRNSGDRCETMEKFIHKIKKTAA